MNRDSTRELIAALASDLAPVRPIPRPGTVTAGLVLLSLGVGAAWLSWRGVRPDFAWGDAAVLVGLLAVGVGAGLAGLAGSVPGRIGATRVGIALASCGLVLAVGLAWSLYDWNGWERASADLLVCQVTVIALALAPLCGMLAYLRRGAPTRPRLATATLIVSATALGAFAVHLGCTKDFAAHAIGGHALAPLVWAVLLAVPLDRVLRASR